MKHFACFILLLGTIIGQAIAAPDLAIENSVDNATPLANEPVEFTIRVTNIGDLPAADIVVFESLPAEMQIPAGTAAFPSLGNYDDQTGEWTVGTLEPGNTAVLIVPAIVTADMPPPCIVNRASVSHPEDENRLNDEARAAIRQSELERCVDLSPTYTIWTHSFYIYPTCNHQERYDGRVEVTNAGPDRAHNVLVAISQSPIVGPNLRFDDTDCSAVAGGLCSIAGIGPGETIMLDVTSDPYQNHNTVEQSITVRLSTSDVDYAAANDLLSRNRSIPDFSNCTGGLDLSGVPDAGIGIGGCFIATAAYGSPFGAHLDALRDFRDRFLSTNRAGRSLVAFYYRHSPPIADFIAERDSLRAVVRGLLTPIVYSIEYPRRAVLVFVAMIGFFIVVYRRKRRCGRNAVAEIHGG